MWDDKAMYGEYVGPGKYIVWGRGMHYGTADWEIVYIDNEIQYGVAMSDAYETACQNFDSEYSLDEDELDEDEDYNEIWEEDKQAHIDYSVVLYTEEASEYFCGCNWDE